MSSPLEWRDWSFLTEPLLIDISRRLDTLQDFFAFRHVCTSWRASAPPSPESLASQHPLLLLFSLHHENMAATYYDIVQRRLYAAGGGGAMLANCLSSTPPRRTIAAYTSGYLVGVTVDHENSTSIVLRRIFTPVPAGLPELIHLPPVTAGGFDLVLLSSQPSSPDCLVLLYSKSRETAVQYLRIGDPQWRVVGRPECRISDIIFFSNELYALRSDSRLLAVHLMDGQLRYEVLLGTGTDDQLVPNVEQYEEMRLAVSDGQLLAICKANFTWVGIKFHVFCWDLERKIWRRRADLGGRALFFGPQGFAGSLAASDQMGIKGDCIYYLGYENDRWYKFSLEDRSLVVVSLPRPPQLGEDHHAALPPIWVLPSIC